jgi:hypothetical protein
LEPRYTDKMKPAVKPPKRGANQQQEAGSLGGEVDYRKMTPVTAAMNLAAAIVGMITVLIERTPPEAIGEAIKRHEARLDRLFAFIDKHE